MAQPTMVTLTGTVQTPPATPDATFQVVMQQLGYLLHSDGTMIEPTTYRGIAAADGSISFEVPASTDPAWDYVLDGKIVGTNWTYRCYFDPVDNGQQGAPFYAGVPHDLGPTLTLNSLIPAGSLSQSALYAPINHTHAGGGGGGAVDSVNGRTGAVVLSKTDVGLGNVDNTADAAKTFSGGQITSGTVAIGRLPTGTTNTTVALGDAPAAAVAAHVAAGDPHPQYLTSAEGFAAYDALGAASAAVAGHVAAGDPHPQYLTATEGNAAYQPLGSYAAAVHTHTASQISDSTATGRSVLTAADAAAARTAIGAGTSSLVVGTTAGTAAEGNDSRITGAAQKSANLSDLANAGTARTNLGLGNSATRAVGTTSGDVAAGDAPVTAANAAVATHAAAADPHPQYEVTYVESGGTYSISNGARTFVGTDDPATKGFTLVAGDRWYTV